MRHHTAPLQRRPCSRMPDMRSMRRAPAEQALRRRLSAQSRPVLPRRIFSVYPFVRGRQESDSLARSFLARSRLLPELVYQQRGSRIVLVKDRRGAHRLARSHCR